MQGFVEPPGWSPRTGLGGGTHGEPWAVSLFPCTLSYLSAICLFLSCVLGDKQGIVSQELSWVVWATLANCQIPIRDRGNPRFTAGWVGAQVTARTCHWDPEWQGEAVWAWPLQPGVCLPQGGSAGTELARDTQVVSAESCSVAGGSPR